MGNDDSRTAYTVYTHLWRALTLLCLALLFLAPQRLFGTDKHWTGSTNTTWGTGTNWFEGSAPGGTTDNAVFDRTFSNQPNLGSIATAGGLWMTGSVGQNVTISGSTLTLQGNTINGTAGLGILIDNANAFTLTINAPLKLGAAQTWRNNSGNLLTIGAGGVNTNNLNLTLDGSGNTTISGVVSSGGAILQSGSGTLTLSGTNTYTAGTLVSAGTLNINSATALGTGALFVSGGTIDNTTAGAITLTNNNAITLSANFTFGGTQNLNFGTGAITNSGNRTITLNGTNSTLTFGGIMSNTLNGVQTTTVNGVGNTLSLGGYVLSKNNTDRIDIINGTGNVTITGAITNGGTSTSGLTYSGSGILSLSGTNTFGGALTIQSGTLSINTINDASTNGVLGNSANAVVMGGSGTTGTLRYTGSTASSTKKFTMASSGTGVFDVTNIGITLTLSGVIDGSGNLTKAGAGTLALSGSNTFSGVLTVADGTLSIASINNASANGVLGNSANAVVMGGSGTTGILSYTGSTASSTKTFTMATSGTGEFDVTNSGTTLTLSGIIGGSGNLTKAGAGTLVLSGSNTFSGVLSVMNGNLSIATINNASTNGVLGNSTNAVVLGGSGTTGTLQYSGATGSSTKKFTMASGGTGTFQIDTSGTTLTLSGVIDGTGALSKTGPGTLVLSGVNTYSGGTTMGAGTLQLSGSGTLGSTSGGLTVNGGTVDLNGTNQGVGNLAGSGGTILNNATATNATLTIGNGNATGGNYAGVIANHTSGTGTVALTKNGTGTLTLSGSNTFTGATTVNGGTLTLAASSGSALGSTTSVTVNSGGTLLLGASNQINNSATMTLAGGTFAKGDFSEGTAGSAGLGALTLTASGCHIDMGTGSVGVLNFASFNPGLNILTIDNWTGTANTVGSSTTDRLIFNSDQTLNLAIFQFNGYSLGAVQFSLGGGFYEVVPITPVPEPATYFAGLLTLGVLAWSQRRRWRGLAARTGVEPVHQP